MIRRKVLEEGNLGGWKEEGGKWYDYILIKISKYKIAKYEVLHGLLINLGLKKIIRENIFNDEVNTVA